MCALARIAIVETTGAFSSNTKSTFDTLLIQTICVICSVIILGQNAFHFGPKRIPFWAKTHPILDQNAFHFGPKRFPFCGKTHPILRQNAFHFAAKRIPFCGKTHFILRQNAFYKPFCSWREKLERKGRVKVEEYNFVESRRISAKLMRASFCTHCSVISGCCTASCSPSFER